MTSPGAIYGGARLKLAGLFEQRVRSDRSGKSLTRVKNVPLRRGATGGSITVSGWLNSNVSQFADIKTSNGFEIDSGLSQLIQAMATYSSNHADVGPTAVSQAPSDMTLQSAMAAAWRT